jgi:hypothetical protein
MDRTSARRALALIAAVTCAAAAGCSHGARGGKGAAPGDAGAPPPAASAPAAPQSGTFAGDMQARAAEPTPPRDPLAAFETVRGVLQSPRCVNCHPAGDVPLQGDDSHLHLQNVRRGPDGNGVAGLECTACHGRANPPDSYGARQPPGVKNGWHLPPPGMKMVFEGVGSRALCEGLKDPTQNGGKDLPALLEHVSADPIVLWGWQPGRGRAPVALPHAEFVSAFRAWADAGAPCPAH